LQLESWNIGTLVRFHTTLKKDTIFSESVLAFRLESDDVALYKIVERFYWALLFFSQVLIIVMTSTGMAGG